MKNMHHLVWFREDLRIQDHTALFHASQKKSEGVIGVYVIDTQMWQQHAMAACRIEFILRGLKKLQQDLEKLNIPLLMIEISKSYCLPEKLLECMQNIQANHLFFNIQYEINERRRDEKIEAYLKKYNIDCYAYEDQTILSPTVVTKKDGHYFKIFTPYKKTWIKTYFKQEGITCVPSPQPQTPIKISSSSIPQKISDFVSTIDAKLWPAGEKAAQHALKKFIAHPIFNYHQTRDFPTLNGTSRLSPYLSCGMISARTCFMHALKANDGQFESGNTGILIWLNELIWRDFYKMILMTSPRVSMNRAYKLNTEKLIWNIDEKKFDAWKHGQTGYPIIDAAMRQLNTTGWMHNRLRMIVAMFFSKNLFFDWRLGEKYFMSRLIDGDLAANNGGWQWSASVGTDAVPYFRIFNPTRQSKRFDPQGQFIRLYCPELKDLDDKSIHEPYRSQAFHLKKINYPTPIVDFGKSRQHAIQAFKTLRAI